MKIVYDPLKNARNLRERGLAFDRVAEIDWGTALVIEDERRTYTESRYVVFGHIEQRLYVACFTPIAGGMRVISFRKANQREIKRYEQKIQTIDG